MERYSETTFCSMERYSETTFCSIDTVNSPIYQVRTVKCSWNGLRFISRSVIPTYAVILHAETYKRVTWPEGNFFGYSKQLIYVHSQEKGLVRLLDVGI